LFKVERNGKGIKEIGGKKIKIQKEEREKGMKIR
jgi:hypothetical protein